MGTKVRPWAIILVRFFIGGLFIYAGLLKMLDPAAFLKAIENYKILPHFLAIIAAFYFPFLELFCGFGLVIRRLYSGAIILLIGLMLLFVVALLSAWARGLSIDCGCFGYSDTPGHFGLPLARDFAILAGLCFLVWRSGSESFPKDA